MHFLFPYGVDGQNMALADGSPPASPLVLACSFWRMLMLTAHDRRGVCHWVPVCLLFSLNGQPGQATNEYRVK